MKHLVLYYLIISLLFDPLAIAQPVRATPVRATSPPAILPMVGAPGVTGTAGGLQPPVFPNYQTGILPPTLVGQPIIGQPMGFRTPLPPPPPPMQYPFAYPLPPPGYQYCNPYSSGYGGYGGYGGFGGSYPTSGIAICPQQRTNLLALMIPMMLMSTLMHGGLGGGRAVGPRAFGGSPGGYSGYLGEVGSGVMEECGALPPQIKKALSEAMDYRNVSCRRFANKGPNKKIAINDFSDVTKPPEMWIFDSRGTCLKRTAVTFGNGDGRVGPNAKPLPCSDVSSDMTPPGFHLTAAHNCSNCKYQGSVSLLMVGLDGQGSAGRGILIHPAESPGTASSWGCAGVGPFQAVKNMLGYGSLVYNYFGTPPTAASCSNQAGRRHECRGPDGGISVPGDDTGDGDPDAVADINPF